MALKRDRNPMPGFVHAALADEKLTAAYEARPDDQKNGYLWRIASPKREGTMQKRLAQLIDELKRGDVYMNMVWRPGR